MSFFAFCIIFFLTYFFFFALTLYPYLFLILSCLMIIYYVIKKKKKMYAFSSIVLPMPVFYLMVISHIFKGGPFHKPYWLPWASLPHPFEFCKCISFKCGKMIIKIIIPGRSCRVRFCGETIASPSGSFFWKEGVNRHDQQNSLMHSKITRLMIYEVVSFMKMSMRICIHRVFS